MAKKTGKTGKGKKRGPKEERLLITDDPEAALQMLLNPPKGKPKGAGKK